MTLKKCFFLFFIFSFTFHLFSSPLQDKTPPSLRWISPAEYSVIKTNTVRLCVEASDDSGGSGIKKVVFGISFYIDITSQPIKRDSIGEANNAPYELVWNCSHLPDQCAGRLFLYCQAEDKAGNFSNTISRAVVLDRNTDYKSIEAKSNYTTQKIIIDGSLSEWKAKDSISFLNNENNVVVYSAWNQQFLYLGAKIYDKSVISFFKEGIHKYDSTVLGNTINAYEEDAVEFFFDPFHNHREIRNLSHKHFLFSAAGWMANPSFDTLNEVDNWNPDILWKTKILGTLNREQDIDTGWVLECAIPWKVLEIKPKKNLSLGFEAWNSNKEFPLGKNFYASWSGIQVPNLQNPSEWGNLRLVKEPNKALVFLIVSAGIFLFILIGYAGIHRFYKQKILSVEKEQEIIVYPPQKEDTIFQTSISYIQEHYKENIKLEDVVKAAQTNTSTFSKIIKEKTGQTFVNYLTQIRIEKSKELLKTTQQSIKEISNNVGFNSIGYFCAAFKKKENMSPLEYRSSFLSNRDTL